MKKQKWRDKEQRMRGKNAKKLRRRDSNVNKKKSKERCESKLREIEKDANRKSLRGKGVHKQSLKQSKKERSVLH